MAPKWNNVMLEAPPVVVYSLKLKKKSQSGWLEAMKLIRDLRDVLDGDLMKLEKHVLTCILRKCKKTLSKEKQYKYLQMLGRCVKNLDLMAIGKVYDLLESSDPKLDALRRKEAVYPSQQVLDCVLLRTVSLANLLAQACDQCYNAIAHTWLKLHHGFFVRDGIVLTSSLSRLWIMFHKTICCAVSAYRLLLPLRSELQAAPIPWLSIQGELPKHLDDILKQGSLAIVINAVRSSRKDLTNDMLADIVGRAYMDELKEPMELEEEIDEPIEDTIETTTLPDEDENLGVVIKRSQSDEEIEEFTFHPCEETVQVETSTRRLTRNELNAQLSKLSSGRKICKWLRRTMKNQRRENVIFRKHMTSASWLALQECINDSLKAENGHVVRTKDLIVNWHRKPKKCLQLYEDGLLDFENCNEI